MKNLVFIGDLERYTNELEKRKKQLERLYKQAINLIAGTPNCKMHKKVLPIWELQLSI